MGEMKWTEEMLAFLRANSPLHEHGYQRVADIAHELNRVFGIEVTPGAVSIVAHRNGITLVRTGNRPRGAAHYRNLPVGTICRRKNGYKEIKVADPDVWERLNRIRYREYHPDEDISGKVIIHLDGDLDNTDEANLYALTKREHIMANKVIGKIGLNPSQLTVDERLYTIAVARIWIAKSQLAGEELAKVRAHLYYLAHKDDPEFKAKKRERERRYRANRKAQREGRL